MSGIWGISLQQWPVHFFQSSVLGCGRRCRPHVYAILALKTAVRSGIKGIVMIPPGRDYLCMSTIVSSVHATCRDTYYTDVPRFFPCPGLKSVGESV